MPTPRQIDYKSDIATGIGSIHIWLEFEDANTHGPLDPRMASYMHALLYVLDADYPYVLDDGTLTAKDKPEICPYCKGLVWCNPRLGPLEITTILREYSLVLSKSSFFRHGQACEDKLDKKQQQQKEVEKSDTDSNKSHDGRSPAATTTSAGGRDTPSNYGEMANAIWAEYAATHDC